MGPRSECFVNAPPHQKFKRDIRNGKVEALLPEAVKLFGNYESANFPLRVRGKRFEDDFSSKRPINSGRSGLEHLQREVSYQAVFNDHNRCNLIRTLER